MVLMITISVLWSVTAALGFQSTRNVGYAFDVLHFQAVPMANSLTKALLAEGGATENIQTLALEQDQSSVELRLKLIETNLNDFEMSMETYSNLANNHFPAQVVFADAIMTEWATYESLASHIIEAARERDWNTVSGMLRSFEDSEAALRNAINDAEVVALEMVSTEETVFADSLNNVMVFNIVIVVSGIITAVFTFVVMGSVSKPIAQLRRATRQVASGDLRSHIQIHRKDDIGDLATDFENMTSKLREKDRLKDEFINIAAHELRTPILPIMLIAEELAERADSDMEQEINILLRNAKRINKLTNEILDASRIESNSLKLNFQKVNLLQLLKESISDIQVSSEKSKRLRFDFRTELPEENYEVICDKMRIQQVVLNLLRNAAEFTDDGTIVVDVKKYNDSPSSGHFEIKVTDSGKGIEEAVREKLFQKFVTSPSKTGGTGLGLFVSKAIIEAHGGNMNAKNNDQQNGATFSFTLPATR